MPLGFLAACLAAAWLIVTALPVLVPPYPPLWWQAFGYAVLVTQAVGSFAAIPAFFAILCSEIFRWRSVFFWLGFGGLLGLAASFLPFDDAAPAVPLERIAVTLLAAGFVGGFVYWLIAGRLAGVAEPISPG